MYEGRAARAAGERAVLQEEQRLVVYNNVGGRLASAERVHRWKGENVDREASGVGEENAGRMGKLVDHQENVGW